MGELVMLNARHISQLRTSKKLADRYLGPFKIIEILGTHKQAYKLELLPSYRIHPVFHVSLLESYRQRAGEEPVKPAEIDLEDQEFWEVEAILAHRDKSKKLGREYLVRWKGFSPSDDSWIPLDNFGGEREMVKEYHREQAVEERLSTR